MGEIDRQKSPPARSRGIPAPPGRRWRRDRLALLVFCLLATITEPFTTMWAAIVVGCLAVWAVGNVTLWIVRSLTEPISRNIGGEPDQVQER